MSVALLIMWETQQRSKLILTPQLLCWLQTLYYLQREGERLFESAAFLSLNFLFPPVILKVLESIALQLNTLWTAFLNSLQIVPHNLMNVLLEGLASLIGTVISFWSLPSCFPREVSTFKTQNLSADIFKNMNNLIHKTVKYLFNHKCDYNSHSL